MDEVVGTSIYERYPEDMVDEIEPKFQAVFEGESSEFEIEYHGHDLSIHALPVENSEGSAFSFTLLVVQEGTNK